MRILIAFILMNLIVSASILCQNGASTSEVYELDEIFNQLSVGEIKLDNKVLKCDFSIMDTNRNENQEENLEAYRVIIPIIISKYTGRVESIKLVLDLNTTINNSMRERLLRIFRIKVSTCEGQFVIGSSASKETNKFFGSGFLEISIRTDSTENTKRIINIEEGSILLKPVKNGSGISVFRFALSEGTDFAGCIGLHSRCFRVPRTIDREKFFKAIIGFLVLLSFFAKAVRLTNFLYNPDNS